MKKILIAILLIFALMTFSFPNSALAAGDAAKGASVFQAKCQVCHKGGKNTVNPQKTLSKSDLEKYGKYSEAAIINQVTNGAGAMPAFGRLLKPQQIENVAAYVFSQSEKGW